LMQNVLSTMGISEETLFISINALKSLYEYDKIHELYTQHALIQDDPILLGAALNALSEEEDYIDFVAEEAIRYYDLLHDEPTYPETLKNVYALTGNQEILEIIKHFEHHHGPHGHHH
jgi:slei family protein